MSAFLDERGCIAFLDGKSIADAAPSLMQTEPEQSGSQMNGAGKAVSASATRTIRCPSLQIRWRLPMRTVPMVLTEVTRGSEGAGSSAQPSGKGEGTETTPALKGNPLVLQPRS